MPFSADMRISKEEISSPPLQPPPTYPPLDQKPLPIQITTEMSYLVELKRDFIEYMRESPNNVQTPVLNEDVERYCEDYDESVTTNKSEYESMHDWTRMPMELKLSQKRKLNSEQSERPYKKQKIMDIHEKLNELEKKEEEQEISEEKIKQENEEEDEEDDSDKESAKEEENEMDEEMDDGTDYANTYFDAGEEYYSEEDNDDGGAIYY